MGKRARRRARESGDATAKYEASAGASRRRKVDRGLGLDLSGLPKPVLDAMNEKSLELHSLGIGVVVQEEHRKRQIADAQPKGKPMTAERRAWKAAQADADLWSGRLRQVAEAMTDELPEGALA